MIVLAPVRRVLRLGGLWFEDGQSWHYRLYRCLCLSVLLMMLQPQYSFLCANLNDMVAATDVSIQLVSEIMASCKVFGYIYYHRTINEMLAMCQRDVDRMERIGRPKRFRKAELELAAITSKYNWSLLMAGIAHNGGPLAILLINYVRGTLEPEMWTHPFSGVYAFDPLTTPGYQFAYLLGITYNMMAALCYSCNDMLFLGLCRYLVAYMQCLADGYVEMDREYAEAIAIVGRKSNMTKANYILKRKMINCIQAHCRILDLLEKVATTQSPVILAQFGGSILILSTMAYQTTISEDEATIIMYVVPAFCVLMELFIFCYYGNLLTSKSLELADELWQKTSFYNYPLHIQKYFMLFLMRLQSPIVLSGYGFVECTLDTFVAAIKMVGSVITLLQSMEDI